MSASSAPSVARLVSRLFAVVLILGAILFGAAGRLDWTEGWLLLALYSGLLLAILGWAHQRAPDLLAERSRRSSNVKRWDLAILRVYGALLITLLVVAALDARFRWSSVSPAVEALGLAGEIASALVIWWTMRANPFLSRWARIQTDRGQAVVSDGPYRYVRHPMYGAIAVLMISMALALGSCMALLPAVLIVALFAVRTILEDRMLRDELPGYREYTLRVCHRWWPGIW
jgi:protein-S-isoprenylcysteine O-methyltransferase Ste14